MHQAGLRACQFCYIAFPRSSRASKQTPRYAAVAGDFTVIQPHWPTVAGAAEALQPESITHLVPVSPVSLPKQAPDAAQIHLGPKGYK
jgi:hypothetical protein